MNKIAVLGPKGTFTDIASQRYLSEHGLDYQKVYFNTFDRVFYSIESQCDLGIIPIENTLDGYVQRTLDLLYETKAVIIDELQIPIQFSLIGNVESIQEVKKVYTQFKANGQCRQFINSLQNIDIYTTETNMETFYKIEHGYHGEAGIISNHMLDLSTASFKMKDITDSKENYTRFFIIQSRHHNHINVKGNKSMIYITCLDSIDSLVSSINILYNFGVKIISISSQPTRKFMGSYHFALEVKGDLLDEAIDELKQISNNADIYVCGIYRENVK